MVTIQLPKRFNCDVQTLVAEAIAALQGEKNPIPGDWQDLPDHELYQALHEEWEELGEALLEEDHLEAMKRAEDAADCAIILCANARRRLERE